MLSLYSVTGVFSLMAINSHLAPKATVARSHNGRRELPLSASWKLAYGQRSEARTT